MKRTINHTGRRKLRSEEAQIRLEYPEGKPPTFDVDFNLDRSSLPEIASIYVEAYQRNTLQRFHFGTVGLINKPTNLSLSELDLSGQILFRVRVVDESEHLGRLIASVESLRPADDQQNRTGLLALRSKPLREETWKVVFSRDGKPELHLNSRIPSAIDQLTTNPQFQSLILPAVLRQVLMYYLWNDEDIEDQSAAADWFQFAEGLAFERPHESDPMTMLNWIDDVVERFSSSFDLCTRLLSKMEGVLDGSS